MNLLIDPVYPAKGTRKTMRERQKERVGERYKDTENEKNSNKRTTYLSQKQGVPQGAA